MVRSINTMKRFLTALAGAAAISAALAPAAIAETDLRMPDTRDVADALAYTDLRMPDTRDAAEALASQDNQQSPTTREADPAPSGGEGFDWPSAALGVAAVTGVLLLLLAAMTGRRRSAGLRSVRNARRVAARP